MTPSRTSLVGYLETLKARPLGDFCAPDATIRSLSSASGIKKFNAAINMVRETCIKDVPTGDGSHYMFAIFESQLLAALNADVFQKRTTLMADLEHLSSSGDGDQIESCTTSSCSATNMFKQVHGLLSGHLFRVEAIGHIMKILQAYGDDAMKLDELIYRLRQLACEELVDYLNHGLTIAQQNINTMKLEDIASLLLQHLIVTFGQVNIAKDLQGLPDVQIDPAVLNKKFEQLLECFNDAMGYPRPQSTGVLQADSGSMIKPDIEGLTASDVHMSIHPQLQSNLEYLLGQLTADGSDPSDTARKGTLTKADRWLTSLRFKRTEDSVPLQHMYTMLVTVMRKMIPMYFPIQDLRIQQNSMGQQESQGLKLGKVAMMIAGSADAVAYSWGDLTVAIIYVVKLVRFLTQLATLWMSVKIFKDAYVQRVYSAREDPPTLQSLLRIFIGIDLTIQLILVTVLVVVVAPGGGATSMVNDEFMTQLLMDEILATAMIALLGSVIASYMWRKTYFHYKLDGLGAVKSFGDIMVGVCATMMVVPFFLLV